MILNLNKNTIQSMMKSTDLANGGEELLRGKKDVFSGSELARYPQYSESPWPKTKTNIDIEKSLRKEKVKEFRI